MANCCMFDGVVKLPEKNVKMFLAFFDWNKPSNGHISRTRIDCDEVVGCDEGITELIIYGECAWSCVCCWCDKIEDGEVVNLQTVLERCEVERFIGRSEEPGIGFYEFFKYIKGDKLIIECFDW